MFHRKIVLLCTFFTCALGYSSSNSITIHGLDNWKTTYLDTMNPQEIQILGNILYNLLSTSIAEWQVQRLQVPIVRLNQTVRQKLAQHENATEELATLKTLMERLSYIANTRTIYIQTTNTCLAHFNQNSIPLIESAVIAMQEEVESILRSCTNEKSKQMAEILNNSSENMAQNLAYLTHINQFHKAISNGEMPLSIAPEHTHDRNLLLFSFLLENSYQALTATEQITNVLNHITEHAGHTALAIATDILRAYYTIIFEKMNDESFDKKYTVTLFGMYDLLAEEFKSTLPDPDHIFEHMLQTAKLYTQTEVSPL